MEEALILFSIREAIIWEAVLCSQPTCIPCVDSLPTCTSTGPTYKVESLCSPLQEAET